MTVRVDVPAMIPDGCPVPPRWPPPVDWWDVVVVALSAGKDSRCVLHGAAETYPRDRLVAVYNVLGNEHPDSIDGARAVCDALGVPLLFTWKEPANGRLASQYGLDLPTHAVRFDMVASLARRRGKWPDRANALCTSTGKRDATDALLRNIDRLLGTIGMGEGRGSRILLLSGERAEESPRRARRPTWAVRRATSPKKERLVLWHQPIHDWSEERVWRFLEEERSPAISESYAQGFSCHSCIHCIHKPWEEQVLAFVLHPGPAAVRVAVEEEIGHRVRLDYFLCRCGSTTLTRRGGEAVCAGCERPASEGILGWRAVWEFVYGPWRGIPGSRPEPTERAIAVIDRLRGRGCFLRAECRPGDQSIGGR